jgi:protein SCO1/2
MRNWAQRQRSLMVMVSLMGLVNVAAAAVTWRYGEPPRSGVGGPIDLVDHRGQAFSLKRVQGQVALVFFGFSHCSTVCPMALFQAKQVLDAFKLRVAPTVLFVSLDPLNDDPEHLRIFLSRFDERVIGLTGQPSAIQAVADRYGVALQGRGAALEHSAKWYLIGPGGQVERVYDTRTEVSALVEGIRQVQQAGKGVP